MTRIIFWLAKEYGWTVDYIMQMGIIQFNEAKDFLKYVHDEEERAYKQSSNRRSNNLTFG